MAERIYCIELKKLMTGEEIWQAKFGRPPVNHTLTFKCPDELCSASFILRNCAAHLEAWETGFRLYPKSVHRQGCTYALAKKALRYKNIKERAQRPVLYSFLTSKGISVS